MASPVGWRGLWRLMGRRTGLNAPRLASLSVWPVGLIVLGVAALQLGIFEHKAFRLEQPASLRSGSRCRLRFSLNDRTACGVRLGF
jgi:hypothetical protein